MTPRRTFTGDEKSERAKRDFQRGGMSPDMNTRRVE